jgi:N6-adenosine-specific RNA methylase IME4
MTALLKYDVACRALAEASTIDEVKDIRDKAEAMRIYARQANNTELEEKAALIRVRGERKLGQMLLEAKADGRLHEGRPKKNGSPSDQLERIKIEDYGIDKRLSVEAQRIGAIPEAEYESLLGRLSETVKARGSRVALIEMSAEEKKKRRAQKEMLLGEYQAALPDKKFGVIVADPEWKFEPYSDETGMDRAAENHYPTTETKKIKVRDVPSIAAADCVLFLWATIPMLPAAFAVMKAWGFAYKSHYVWGKDKIGLGYWNREKHELFLIGTRGNPPAPAPGTQRESLIMAPRGSHSAKPDVFLEMIEQYYPTLPKIELNRRGPSRQGWDAWGNESEERITDDSRTNHVPKPVPDSYGTDAAQSKASVSEPASDHQPKAPHVPVADAGSPSSLPELVLPGLAPTFAEFAAFTDLTNPLHGRAS